MKDTTLDVVDAYIDKLQNGDLWSRLDQAYALTRILDTRMIYLANKELTDNTDKDSGQES